MGLQTFFAILLLVFSLFWECPVMREGLFFWKPMYLFFIVFCILGIIFGYHMNSEQSQGHGDVHVCFSYITVGSVQFHCSVVSDSLWPHEPSTPGLPVHHQLLQLAQTHVHRVTDPSNHLILCHPLLLLPSIFPSIRVFSNESALHIRWPKCGASASASVLPVNTQDWSPLGWTGWISMQSKGLLRVFSNTAVQKHQFFGTQLSL